MTVEVLAAWLVTAMTFWVPPTVHKEGEVRALERYQGIASDIAAVALDPEETPLFEGDRGRAQTALLVASVASLESGYREDVDTGKVRGDHGRSWCVLQVQVWNKTAEAWTGKDLIDDRTRCVRAGLHRMHTSFTECHALGLPYRLAGYTTGLCREEPKAHYRMMRALNFWKKHPFGEINEI